MLPAVTTEDVKTAVDFLQLTGIGQVELQRLVLTLLGVLLPGAGAVLRLVVVGNLTVLVGDVPTRSCRIVKTEVQVSAKSLKELELIIELGVAHEAANVAVLVLLFQLCKWIQSRHCVGGTVLHPIVVASIFIIYRLQWIVLYG